MTLNDEFYRAGIFGPSLSGKTTLAKALSRKFWNRYRMKSIVLDPNSEVWGDHAVVTDDEEKFWSMVWASRNALVIVEESSETIARDKDKIKVFTRLRHLQHRLIVVGHSGASLLPVMRQQFDTLYLFLQSKSASRDWSEDACCEALLAATSLQRYEFLHYERYKPVRKCRLELKKK